MDAKVRVHGHFNGLKTTLLFALMWAIIMLIWWATGGSRQTLSIYIVIGLITTFGTYWFSDKHNLCTYNLIRETDLFGLADDEKEILAAVLYYAFDGTLQEASPVYHSLTPRDRKSVV